MTAPDPLTVPGEFTVEVDGDAEIVRAVPQMPMTPVVAPDPTPPPPDLE